MDWAPTPGEFVVYIPCMFYLMLPTGELGYLDRVIYGEWEGKPGDKLTEFLNLLGDRYQPPSLLVRQTAAAEGGVQSGACLYRPGPACDAGVVVGGPEHNRHAQGRLFLLVIGALGIIEILDADQVMRLTAFIGAISAALSLIVPDPAYAIPAISGGCFRMKMCSVELWCWRCLGAFMVSG